MAKTILRDKARAFRSKGLSLNEIALKLRVPKSTTRYWCRDIILTHTQLSRLFKKQTLGGIHVAEKLRTERLNRTRLLMQEGAKEVGAISQRELFLIGTALYWAEGYRKGNGEFGFTNSDPQMVKIMLRWLHKVCNIQRRRIRLRVCINISHKQRLLGIHKFWSKITKTPLRQFSKPTLIRTKSTKQYLNSSKYFGTLRVKVQKSTDLRRKIVGWINGIAR